jgi:HD-GYP domain-containing protein (c-di-GMP phosphodiesterase class II)
MAFSLTPNSRPSLIAHKGGGGGAAYKGALRAGEKEVVVSSVPQPAQVDLGQALFVLSDALDLVGVDDVFHGKRVAWLVQQLLTLLGEPRLLREGRHASLIHDCGVSSTRHHQQLVEQLTLVDAHSEQGAKLVSAFAPLAHLGPIIEHHHTPWSKLQALEPRTATLANVIFLADRLDVLQARQPRLAPSQLQSLVRTRLLEPHAGLFAPRFVEATEALLTRPEVSHVLKLEHPGLFAGGDETTTPLSAAELRGLAHLFAQTVDAKSAYTARHSHGVAALAVHLAQGAGLPRAEVDQVEVAALLHDLGKLQIPDEVLDKPGPLTPQEFALMRRHAQGSHDILARIPGLERVAELAGLHHELLDGSGYPRGYTAERIPLAARVITVADIFQALAQHRPYRRALAPEVVVEILREYVRRGRLDAGLVQAVESDLATCWQLALVDEPA